ncbi:MAG: hypothetical protein PHS92_01320 [Candidatus Gracilibacteria bacterium]|nr:hypothetical protein [Candidatus Gracilibacteria bacterium]
MGGLKISFNKSTSEHTDNYRENKITPEVQKSPEDILNEITNLEKELDRYEGDDSEFASTKISIINSKIRVLQFQLSELSKKETMSNEVPFRITGGSLLKVSRVADGKLFKPKTWHTDEKKELIGISSGSKITKTGENSYSCTLNFNGNIRNVDIEYFGDTVNIFYNGVAYPPYTIDRRSEVLVKEKRGRNSMSYTEKPKNIITFGDITLELSDFR